MISELVREKKGDGSLVFVVGPPVTYFLIQNYVCVLDDANISSYIK
jgi:hypothetical protein